MEQMASFCETVSRWTSASESSAFDAHHLGQRVANSTFLPTTRFDHVWKMTNMVQTNHSGLVELCFADEVVVVRLKCWKLLMGGLFMSIHPEK